MIFIFIKKDVLGQDDTLYIVKAADLRGVRRVVEERFKDYPILKPKFKEKKSDDFEAGIVYEYGVPPREGVD